MKRDIDLCRQLLFDLEAKGSEHATSVLRSDVAADADQRVRYHLRLLVDAGLVKEVARSSSATTCVRLTNAGHEFIELSRGEGCWHDAKHVVLNRTGGLSLTVIKAVLTKWAIEGLAGPRRQVRRRVRRVPQVYGHQPRYTTDYFDGELLRDEAVRAERARYVDDFTVVRTRPDYRERFDYRESVADLNGHGYTTASVVTTDDITLPIYMV